MKQNPAGRNDYPWGRSRPFNDYSGFFKTLFANRVQKISLDAGFTCPNRDGTKGVGGCSYCDNSTFNPDYCFPEKSITVQLNEGISFFRKRYPGQQYLAYFQAYTNTYAELDVLKMRYEEALLHPDVVGVVIGTRPDCISTEILEYLDELAKNNFVSLEFGVESTNDHTLSGINRGHSFRDTINALEQCSRYNFYTGIHMILGLPGEDETTILKQTSDINALPFNFLKLHQMQIIRHTRLARQYNDSPELFMHFSASSYIQMLIRYVELLRPDIIIERFVSESPPDKLIAPKWGLKNFEFVALLEKELVSRQTFQGRLYNG